jgi:hypothetical protein
MLVSGRSRPKNATARSSGEFVLLESGAWIIAGYRCVPPVGLELLRGTTRASLPFADWRTMVFDGFERCWCAPA